MIGLVVKQESPSREECWELVRRIAAAPQLCKSARLAEVLSFLCRRALDESATELPEQEIGTAVFRRAPDYDTAVDPIVRVQVSQLRKKLQQYFESEGQGELLRLEIPKGSYLPFFHRIAPAPKRERPGPSWRFVIALGAMLALSAGLCALLIVRPARPLATPASPALHKFWSGFFRPNRQTEIVVADSTCSFIQDGLQHPLSLEQYVQGDWLKGADLDARSLGLLHMLTARRYASVADLTLVRRIASQASSPEQVSVVFARDYRVRDTGARDLILLGSARSNPWVGLYDKNLNFRFEYDEKAHKVLVRNRSPKPEEAPFYTVAGEGAEIREGYAVIALVSNPAQTSNVLILAGTDMEATEAAGQLVTSEAQLAPVIGILTPHSEALLKTRRLAGAPTEYKVVAYRSSQ